MIIKLDNLDCFRFKNYKTAIFINLDECIKICKNENINIFIKYKNMIYFRKENYKDCIKNIVYVKAFKNIWFFDDFENGRVLLVKERVSKIDKKTRSKPDMHV